MLQLRTIGRFLLATGLITAFSGLSTRPAAAAGSTPAGDLKAVIEDVQNTVKAERGKSSEEVLDGKLKEIIFPIFNFEEMSKRSLGASWNKATPEEQKEFVALFSDLLSRTYLKKIKQNAEGSVLLQISDSVDGEQATVRSKIKAGEDEIQIDYRMSQSSGRWRVYDVMIEHVGLVSNYRNEFPGIVRNEGFQGLIKRLKEKKIGSSELKKS